MEIVLSVFLVASILISGVVLGLFVPIRMELKRCRVSLVDKVAEFEQITKAASEANISMANKILQLEEKISNFEFWKASKVK